jgi:hypothetical protein
MKITGVRSAPFSFFKRTTSSLRPGCCAPCTSSRSDRPRGPCGPSLLHFASKDGDLLGILMYSVIVGTIALSQVSPTTAAWSWDRAWLAAVLRCRIHGAAMIRSRRARDQPRSENRAALERGPMSGIRGLTSTALAPSSVWDLCSAPHDVRGESRAANRPNGCAERNVELVARQVRRRTRWRPAPGRGAPG